MTSLTELTAKFDLDMTAASPIRKPGVSRACGVGAGSGRRQGVIILVKVLERRDGGQR